jgi:hypothetical protein
MRKLRLDLGALAVDTCAPRAEEPVERGTVNGHLLVDTGVYSCAFTCRCPSHHSTECCAVI